MLTREWQDSLKPTALHVAVGYQKIDDVKALLKKKDTNVNAVSHEGFTPLHLAVEIDNVEIAQLLLRHHAKIDILSAEGFTPLQLAASLGRKKIILLLLDWHADPFLDNRGVTARDFARMSHYDDIVALLPGDNWLIYKFKSLFRDDYSSQSWITWRMEALGYDNRKGICFGFSGMAMQAFLSGTMPTYLDRQRLIRDLPINNFVGVFEAIKEKKAQGVALTPDEKYILTEEFPDLEAYFFGMMMYQSTIFYTYLLQRQQRLRAILSIQNYSLVTPIVQSIALEKLGGSAAIGDFSGPYALAGLDTLFELLQAQFKQAKFPVGLLLTSIDHAIFVGYDARQDKWTFADANDPDETLMLRSTQEISSSVHDAFFAKSAKEAVVISGAAFVTSHYKDEAVKIYSQLEQKPAWRQLHKVTFKKASTFDAGGGNWYLIAIKSGIPFGKGLLLGALSVFQRHWKLILALTALFSMLAVVSVFTAGILPCTLMLASSLAGLLGCSALVASAISSGIIYGAIGALISVGTIGLGETILSAISAKAYRLHKEERASIPVTTQHINATLTEHAPLLSNSVMHLPESPEISHLSPPPPVVALDEESIKSSHQSVRKQLRKRR